MNNAHKEISSSKNQSIIAEAWDFLSERKAWWLIPLVVMLGLSAILIIFGQSSAAVSPFIYPLF